MGEWQSDARDTYEFNERLITEVEERRALWDTRNPVPKFVRDDGWKLVAAALGTPEELVQRRWKNLRDTFLRKLRKLEASQDNRLVIRWCYFKRLMFLHDCVSDSLKAEKSLPKFKCERPASRRSARLPASSRSARLPANPRWMPPTKPVCKSVAEEVGSNDAPEPAIGSHCEEESVEFEGEDDPALIKVVPIDCEPPGASPAPSSETSSQVDDSAEEMPASSVAVNTSSLVLSDVRSLASRKPAVISRRVHRRHLSELGGGSGSSAAVPDSSGDARPLGQVEDRLDDWDHFLASLKRHLRSTPDRLVGNAQMHLLQVAVSYGAGKIPATLLPLGEL